MEIIYLPSSNPDNITLRQLLSQFKQVERNSLPDTPICKFTFMISLSKVLNNDTEALMLRTGNSIVGLVQLKMVGNSIFISNFCSVLRGSGGTLLNKVIELAKKHKIDISLSADEFGDNPDGLIKYYQQFGFINTNGNNMLLKAGSREMKCKLIKGDKLIKDFGYFKDTEQVGSCSVKEYIRGELAGSYLLTNVNIDEKYRGKGLCAPFLKCVLKMYSGKTIYLTVLTDNIPAVKCYTSLGFKEIDKGRKTLFMRKGE